MAEFEVGRRYNRRKELHGVFGGQEQGGISTPRGSELIFLFTGESGSLYGYEDRYMPDGTFWYTGEGQVGNMEMVRGNRAVRDHRANGKAMHLFAEAAEAVQYRGYAVYLGHHIEERLDREGDLRDAIVFELDVDESAPHEHVEDQEVDTGAITRPWSRPLAELRELALKRPRKTASLTEKRAITYRRSEAVKTYVLRRANGTCEACEQQAPFTTRAGRPFLEPHHIRRLADGGPDHPRWVAAVCPNCHSEAHYGKSGGEVNGLLEAKLGQLEPED